MKKGISNGKRPKSGAKTKKTRRTPAQRLAIDSRKPNDWRVELLARIRELVLRAAPEIVEEVKWRKPSNSMRGVPAWSRDGLICTGETYKNVVKITFAKGAALKDPTGLFNAGLEGNTRRAIDFHEGDKIDGRALQALIRAAVALNMPA